MNWLVDSAAQVLLARPTDSRPPATPRVLREATAVAPPHAWHMHPSALLSVSAVVEA